MTNTHRPCFWFFIILGAGIVMGKFLPCPALAWLSLGVFTGVIGAGMFWRKTVLVYAAIFLLGVVLMQGAARLPADHIGLCSLGQCRQIKAMEGMVDTDAETQTWAQGTRQVFDVRLARVLTGEGWLAKQGKLRVQLYQDKPIRYGQRLRLSGHIHPIFDAKSRQRFSYRQYLKDRGIYWAMSVGKNGVCVILEENRGNVFAAASIRIHHWCRDVFVCFLGEHHAGMIIAMVLGDRSNMPRDLKMVFVNTGTAHILAISGMNMTVIAAMAFFIFKLCGLPRLWQFGATIAFLFGYAFLSGWTASVVRSCLMTSTFLAAFALEQEPEALNSLGLAGLILLLIDPRNLFDAGFQLSFAAVAAILTCYESCRKLFAWLPPFLSLPLAVSLAAWAGTAGFIAYHFGMVTPVAVVANIPIVPMADLVMALGLGLIAAGLCAPAMAYAVAGCLKAVFSAMVILAGWFSQIPGGHFQL